MICNGCGNDVAYRIRVSKQGEICDGCGGLGAMSDPDVYFDKPYVDPHLVDVNNPAEHHGALITSKADKKARLKRLGMCEAGDRHHGAGPDDKIAQKHAERSWGGRL